MTTAEITAAKLAFADRILADLDHADPKFWAGELGLIATVGEVPNRLRVIRCGAGYVIATNGSTKDSPIFELV